MNKPLSQEDIRKYNFRLWKVLIAGIVLFALFIIAVGFGLFGELPSFRDIEHPKSNQASEVVTEEGKVLGTYFVQNRSNVTYPAISPNVINALIATEDIRFKEHSGIDFKRTFTIFLYAIIGKKQGGSTITQQLALNLFSEEGRQKNFAKRLLQKFQEWVIAVKLERNYTKEEIIVMYLNTVDFGNQAYGIKSAARVYFNTTPDKLSVGQAATLVGILKGISRYSPTRNPDRSLARRNTIMGLMVKADFLTEPDFEKEKEKPLALHFSAATVNDGIAPYFRAVLKNDIKKIFQDRSILKSDGTPYDLDRDGLRITTTINYDMQVFAEEAQKEYMKTLQVSFNNSWKGRNPFKGKEMQIEQGVRRSDRYKALQLEGKSSEEIKADFNTPTRLSIFTWRGNVDTLMKPIDSVKYYKLLLRNAMMAMDPQSGYVKAWVGGINYEHFKYDQVKMGTRQVGSTAKPFTYTVAIENGYSPCFSVLNEPVTIEVPGSAPWTPRSSGTVPGYLTLQKALALSQNYIAAFLMKQVGPIPVATLAKKMGITSEVPAYPSIALGSFDASVYDMVGAYSVFANKGVWNKPTYILKIEDKNGVVLYSEKPIPVPAISEEVAYVMTRMLRGVITNGTGWRLAGRFGVTGPIGGKTGTTNANSDGWFMAITPQLVAGVWTGCEDRAFHFTSTAQGDGATTALPIYAGFMKRVYASSKLKMSKADFEPPKNGVSITFDCNQYQQQEQKTELDEKLGF
ncbi:penicillin-binding protein 1A [Pedobacter steynii]|uniref:Penicillin-binding protein 1A n=1 Tax=Pedobacter steynii TaxID=430522 RepID=A0A1H0LRF1_9SPHI|nr:transglycosylase domain-containing protein [Pedobacter steynii]NQX43550.1 transglycosylase domain-containing protein [Pedobacter steynii]SDO70621.1 penicillin-binding protein 1A [Pedobacter steynii]